MPYDRNRFGDDDDYGRRDAREGGWGRDYTYSSARDYAAAGRGERDDRNFRGGGTGYGGGFRGGRDEDRGWMGERSGGDRYRSYDHDGERFTERGGREEYSRTGSWGGNQDWQRERGRGGGGERGYSGHGGGNRFTGGGGSRGGMFAGAFDRDDDHRREQDRGQQGYGSDDRGFFDRAGDEVRSWFGDREAERRREMDQRYDEAMGGGSRGRSDHDEHYHNWRREQIAQLDRDYDEYRREHGTKFRNEFGTWRSERQTQRECLNRVNEHMEVVGSDGQHIGTVDKVQGDRILLTKNDVDAGGRHHSIPSRWIDRVDDKVTIRKTAEEAKREWRDEERNSAFFGDQGAERTSDTRRANDLDTARGIQGRREREKDDGDVDLNRSFSGTYKD
jgi:hypothetical protein